MTSLKLLASDNLTSGYDRDYLLQHNTTWEFFGGVEEFREGFVVWICVLGFVFFPHEIKINLIAHINYGLNIC